MARRVQRRQVSAHARSDQRYRAAVRRTLNHAQLTGDRQVLKVALGQIGNLQLDSAFGESLPEELCLLRSGSGGESVQVDYPRFAHFSGTGTASNLISASAPNFLKGE